MATLGVGSGTGMSVEGLASTLGVASGVEVSAERLVSTVGVASGTGLPVEGLVPKSSGSVTPFCLAHVWGSRPL